VVTNNIGQLTLSAQLSSRLSGGLSGKFLYNSNYGNKKGADFDLGLLFHPQPHLWVGLAGENLLATDMRPEDVNESNTTLYPTRLGRAGISYELDNLHTLLATDVILKNVTHPSKKNYLHASVGIESWMVNTDRINLALRAGYTWGEEYGRKVRQPAFGGGVKYKATGMLIQVDYSWQRYPYKSSEKFAGDHRISLAIHPVTTQHFKKEDREDAFFTRKELSPQKSIGDLPARLKFKMNSRVEQVFINKGKSILFLLKPQVDFSVSEWRLYICKDKPKGSTEDQMQPYLLRVLHGRGMPAFGILWDLKVEGKRVGKGRYFYSLHLMDDEGNRWQSAWQTFRVR